MDNISDLTNRANEASVPPSSRSNTIPRPAPAIPRPASNTVPSPAPAPVQVPRPATSTSAPITLSQGDTYDAPGAENVNNNVQASSNNSDKPKLNLKIIGLGVIIGVIAIILISVLGKLDSKPKEPVEELPTDITYQEPIYEVPTNYTAQEIVSLRAAGYSLDEMENAFACGISCEDMLMQAEAERQAWIDEAVAPYFDTTSDEYKADMAQTWKGLTKFTDTDKYIGVSQELTKTRNLDFEKIDVHGGQLFIKIYLQEEPCAEYFFHQCTMEEWKRLPDSGNVIATYTYQTAYYDDGLGSYIEDFDRIFIISSSIEIFD